MASDPIAPQARPPVEGVAIRPAEAQEAEELLPLIRAYCDFYEAKPPDAGLLEMARTLATDPSQGAIFVACLDDAPVGFATLDWKWSSLKSARIGFLEDIYVHPDARGLGIADALIETCADRCRELGMPALQWLTQPENKRAQRVYDRTGAGREALIEYDLEL
jgi:GNAT superfamily N-acetyltransferase